MLYEVHSINGVGEGVGLGVGSGVGAGVGAGVAGHPFTPRLVNVYKGGLGTDVEDPIITTVLVGYPSATAVHLKLVVNVPGEYAIDHPVELSSQASIL
jgi:hypothetical protein